MPPQKQSNLGDRSPSDVSLDALSNHQIVTLAVALCGGVSLAIDTEDVAVRANDLTPGRFAWRKYAEQISLEHIRVALSDAKKVKNGSLVSGSGDEGWMLTPSGQALANQFISLAGTPAGRRRRLSNDERRWQGRERRRLLGSESFAKYSEGRKDALTVQDAERFFRLNAYVTGTTRRRKLDRFVNLLGDDEQLGPLVRHLVGLLGSGDGDG